jgi:hypothetical protein
MAKEKWIMCPVCEGNGKHVNPAIDCQGLTSEDFDQDPDFMDDYMSGLYDVVCAGCHGQRVVTAERIEELQQHAEDRELAAREDGNYEAYCGARDWRWG